VCQKVDFVITLQLRSKKMLAKERLVNINFLGIFCGSLDLGSTVKNALLKTLLNQLNIGEGVLVNETDSTLYRCQYLNCLFLCSALNVFECRPIQPLLAPMTAIYCILWIFGMTGE
jgi:hypothetical protein